MGEMSKKVQETMLQQAFLCLFCLQSLSCTTIQELAEGQIHWYDILLYTASKKEPLHIKGDLSMNS